MSQTDSMVIFAKTHDFLAWLVPKTNTFPKLHRHTITRRLLDASLDFLEQTLEANGFRGRERLNRLQEADASLDKVRLYLRLTYSLGWLNLGQYEHVSRMVAELGRLLGGWLRRTQR